MTQAENSPLNFHGQCVLVTGAGGTLGAGIALRFARAGAAVGVHYHHSAEQARGVAQEIRALGGRAALLQADVSRPAEAAALVQQAVRELGGLDVLVNNAGSYPVSPLLDMAYEQWQSVLDNNLTGAFLCLQAAARHMAATGRGGVILNIASIEANSPTPGHAHYSAAKAGLVMLTRTAACELGACGIRVNAVSPGLIWKPGLEQAWPEGVQRWQQNTPTHRLGQPSDIAEACLFLASPAAAWITGENLVVDGGMMNRCAA